MWFVLVRQTMHLLQELMAAYSKSGIYNFWGMYAGAAKMGSQWPPVAAGTTPAAPATLVASDSPLGLAVVPCTYAAICPGGSEWLWNSAGWVSCGACWRAAVNCTAVKLASPREAPRNAGTAPCPWRTAAWTTPSECHIQTWSKSTLTHP